MTDVTTRKTKVARKGRKPTVIDWEAARACARAQCTLIETAAILRISKVTLIARIQEEEGAPSFAIWFELWSAEGHANLRKRQIELMQQMRCLPTACRMAIHLGKNWIGQADKNEIETKDTTGQDAKQYSKDELLRIVGKKA